MTLRIGLVGCGNISDIYLRNATLFPDIRFTACADLRPEAAAARAEKYRIAARSVDDLIGSDDVDIVLNLTVPEAHADVCLAAIENGKHVYVEKPLAVRLADGSAILDAAKEKGVRVGAAPDTVLGAGVQTARRLIDGGTMGGPVFGVAAVMSHGMEDWHPNPEFFFKPGGGPVLDMGPYYLATLVTLLGPVTTVAATGLIGNPERTVTTPDSPFRGRTIKVETLTTLQALLTFRSGAQVALHASWDAWRSHMPHIELHGTESSLSLPDPNWFGGDVLLSRRGAVWEAVPTDAAVFGRRNFDTHVGPVANYRGLGLADMARAIAEGRDHRANGTLAHHLLAVMTAVLEAADTGRPLPVTDSCERPAPLDEIEAAALTGVA